MSTLIGALHLEDGGTMQVRVPDDGGVEVEIRPFANGGPTPAVATMRSAHARELAGLLNLAVGLVIARSHERAEHEPA